MALDKQEGNAKECRQGAHDTLEEVFHCCRQGCRFCLVMVCTEGIDRDCRQFDKDKDGEEVRGEPDGHGPGKGKEEERVIELDGSFGIKRACRCPCCNGPDARYQETTGQPDVGDRRVGRMLEEDGQEQAEDRKEDKAGQGPAPVAEVWREGLCQEIHPDTAERDKKGHEPGNIDRVHNPAPRITTVTSATRTPTNIAMFQFASRFSIPMATVPAAKSSRVPAVANE